MVKKLQLIGFSQVCVRKQTKLSGPKTLLCIKPTIPSTGNKSILFTRCSEGVIYPKVYPKTDLDFLRISCIRASLGTNLALRSIFHRVKGMVEPKK